MAYLLNSTSSYAQKTSYHMSMPMSDILEHVYAYAQEFGLKVYEQTPNQ